MVNDSRSRELSTAGASSGMDLSLWLIEHFLGNEMRKYVERLTDTRE